MSEFHSTRAASSPTPQIAGDVREALHKLAVKRTVRETHAGPVWNGGFCELCKCEWDEPFKNNEHHTADCIITITALSPQSQTAPPFARWADIIESASLAISPKGSEALDALAAEVRAYDVSKL